MPRGEAWLLTDRHHFRPGLRFKRKWKAACLSYNIDIRASMGHWSCCRCRCCCCCWKRRRMMHTVKKIFKEQRKSSNRLTHFQQMASVFKMYEIRNAISLLQRVVEQREEEGEGCLGDWKTISGAIKRNHPLWHNATDEVVIALHNGITKRLTFT